MTPLNKIIADLEGFKKNSNLLSYEVTVGIDIAIEQITHYLEEEKEVIMQAHMAGQFDGGSGVDPSVSESLVYFQLI